MRKTLFASTIVAASISIGLTGPAAAAGADRTTGDAEDEVRTFVVSAHGAAAERPAKGEATLVNKTSARNWTMAVADYREVNDSTGCFIGPITGGDAVPIGRWMRVVVVDHGPGEADQVFTKQESQASAMAWFGTCSLSSLDLQLTADSGNLTVH